MVRILHEKCDPKAGDNPKLPYNSYIIEYMEGDKTFYDVAVGDKAVEIFDYYYDKSSKFVDMRQSGGLVNPKQWIDPLAPAPKKKGKR
jgi:hypothetical protein|tara:strand:+ start:353 stop:616 length:264 start_codon:yes stop_codon:yes gene_type:complete